MYTTIDDYLTLSIADLKRMGFLRADALVRGNIRFSVRGEERAAVGAATDTRGVPVFKLAYLCNGKPVDAVIYLRWKRSNLNPESNNGYYYFVCPRTGKLCRKLYIVNGEFMGRQAFNPIYKKQTYSHRRRNDVFFNYLDVIDETDRITKARYRRETYRGKPTPWGRYVAKTYDRYMKFDHLLTVANGG